VGVQGLTAWCVYGISRTSWCRNGIGRLWQCTTAALWVCRVAHCFGYRMERGGCIATRPRTAGYPNFVLAGVRGAGGLFFVACIFFSLGKWIESLLLRLCGHLYIIMAVQLMG
jgi:hypothetical protein